MIHVKNCSHQAFEEMLETGTQVVSFGAGKALYNRCKEYPKLASSVIYTADNYKTGTIDLNGYTVPIRRMDQCEKTEGVIYLISSLQYAVEIIKQLDQIEKYDGLDVYVPAMFTYEATDDGTDHLLHKSGGKQLIPKTIHYCWFGGKELPEIFRANIETWRKYCPEYEIICWDENNYDVTKNLYTKQAYEAKQWGFVSDYARLDVVDTYGGIYLDTDVELLKPLDELLQFKFYCGFGYKDSVNFGLGFGSQKNSGILREMMALYDQKEFINKDGTLNRTICPVYQTQVMEAHGLVRNGTTQITQDYTVLAPEYLSPINFYGFGRPTARSYSIHQYTATWHDSKEREVQQRMVQNYKYVLNRLQQSP